MVFSSRLVVDFFLVAALTIGSMIRVSDFYRERISGQELQISFTQVIELSSFLNVQVQSGYYLMIFVRLLSAKPQKEVSNFR